MCQPEGTNHCGVAHVRIQLITNMTVYTLYMHISLLVYVFACAYVFTHSMRTVGIHARGSTITCTVRSCLRHVRLHVFMSSRAREIGTICSCQPKAWPRANWKLADRHSSCVSKLTLLNRITGSPKHMYCMYIQQHMWHSCDSNY